MVFSGTNLKWFQYIVLFILVGVSEHGITIVAGANPRYLDHEYLALEKVRLHYTQFKVWLILRRVIGNRTNTYTYNDYFNSNKYLYKLASSTSHRCPLQRLHARGCIFNSMASV